MSPAERTFVSLVSAGWLVVDDLGRVWKRYRYDGVRKLYAATTELRRADRPKSAEYLSIGVRICRKSLSIQAHRLVHLVRIGPIPDGYVVHHKNSNGRDNRPENLVAIRPNLNIKLGMASAMTRSERAAAARRELTKILLVS